jgi:hypothetical protein
MQLEIYYIFPKHVIPLITVTQGYLNTHKSYHSNIINLTFILIMWTFGQAPNNASKWEMGFNSVA